MKSATHSTKCLFLLFVFLTFSFIYLFFASKTKAADPIPPPGKIPCSTVKDPEYNSSRPYQASPCGDSPKATFCGNTLKITESVSRERESDFADTWVLSSPIRVDKTYTISIKDMELPILGNTELTKNSESPSDQIDDATKMNEYVSWYLNGTTTRAEYGNTDLNKLVDYSGPVRKLLPQTIQEAQRIETINSYQETTTYTPDNGGVTENPEGEITEKENHNQIVVCAKKQFLAGLLGKAVPHECYSGSGAPANDEYRLSDWYTGTLGITRSISNAIKQALLTTPGITTAIIEKSLGEAWNKRTPPLPWGVGPDGKPFASSIYYQKAYNEWRGKSCVIVPFFELLICVDNPLVTNEYSDLFSYVPLANTTDKNAKIPIDPEIQIIASGGTVIEKPEEAYQIYKEPAAFFAHTKEDSSLATSLSNTFVPKSGTDDGLPATTEDNSSTDINTCKTIDVRTNEGDNLFVEVPPDSYVFSVHFTFKELGCQPPKVVEFSRKECEEDPNHCGTHKIQICNGEVDIVAPTITKTPYANKIWTTTTGGDSSIVKRIFPKVEEGSPISCIADMPTVTTATYTFDGVAGGSALSKTGALNINEPGDTKVTVASGESVESKLYFPHLGSVYEYFLKGVQTALRPKGYGNGEIFNCTPEIPVECGDWEKKLKGTSGECGICNAPIGNLAKKILTAAGTAYNVPAANIWAAMKHEGASWDEFGTFSDADVRKWSNSKECGGEPMPRCDNNNDATQPPFGFLSKWFYLGDGESAIWRAVQVIDPSRNTKQKVSRCNFLDAAFAAAKSLQQGASNTTAGTSCGKYSGFNTTSPGSCSSAFWTDTKVAQSQNSYAGICVQGPYYTLEQAVSWYHEASCK